MIQSEVSNAIAKALQATLSPEEQKRINAIPTQNLEAYEAYLLGRQKWTARSATSTAESVTLFQKAVDLDPDFAQAYAGLGDAYRHQVWYGGLRGSDVLPNAERAIELNPNYSMAYNWLGLLLNGKGEFEKALEVFRKGLEVDPLSAVLRSNIAHAFGSLGRFDEMKAGAQRIIEISPDTFLAYAAMFEYHYYARGRLDEAIPWHLQAIDKGPHQPTTPTFLGTAFLDLGDDRSAGSWIGRAADIRADNVDVSFGQMMLALYHDDLETAARRPGQQQQWRRATRRDRCRMAC